MTITRVLFIGIKYIIKPRNINISDNLSVTESNNEPNFVIFFVFLAIKPSKTSERPVSIIIKVAQINSAFMMHKRATKLKINPKKVIRLGRNFKNDKD